MSEENIELRDCPFCGSFDVIEQYLKYAVAVKCLSCKTFGPHEKSLEEAIAKWNTRAPVSQWISVGDRLPEFSKIVHRRILIWDEFSVREAWFDGDSFKEWDANGIPEVVPDVKLWQPLPPPPIQPAKLPHTFSIVFPGANKVTKAK